MSVHPSICPQGTTRLPSNIFVKFYIWVFFENLSRIFSTVYSHKNNGHFTWRPKCIFDLPRPLLIMRNVSDKTCTENQNIHFALNSFFFFENNAFHEIKWKKILQSWTHHWWQYGASTLPAGHLRPQISTNYCSSTVGVVAREHFNVTLYVHCLSCVYRIQINK